MKINLINTAYDLEIAKELKNVSAITNPFAFRFVKRMVDEYGVSRLNADWAISVWCVYYGQNVLKKPCEIKISRAQQGDAPSITEEKPAIGKRFIYAYQEQSSYSTVDFLKRAITYFGYTPNILQTDNGGEFTHTQKTNRIHPLDVFCNTYNIDHKTIRPRTPWHNGKVERSHRNDQERFYNYLKFYFFHDLQEQMKRYLYRSNNIPMAVLDWKSPNQKHREFGGR